MQDTAHSGGSIERDRYAKLSVPTGMGMVAPVTLGPNFRQQRKAHMQILPQGQFIKHVQYGLGVVTQSDAERTSIDFHLHGPKKFVTQLMTVELTDEAPPPKLGPSVARKQQLRLPSRWR